MHLSREEFERIRPLHWSLRTINNRAWYTLTSVVETQLFWLDFVRLVFAPRFAQQETVQEIGAFDQRQPVLLSENLELVLPADMESATFYESNRDSSPVFCKLSSCGMNIWLIVAIIVMLMIIFLSMVRRNEPRSVETSSNANRRLGATNTVAIPSLSAAGAQ